MSGDLSSEGLRGQPAQQTWDSNKQNPCTDCIYWSPPIFFFLVLLFPPPKHLPHPLPRHVSTQVHTGATTTEQGRVELGGTPLQLYLRISLPSWAQPLVTLCCFLEIQRPACPPPTISPVSPRGLPRQSLTVCSGHLETFSYRKDCSV